MSKLDKLVAAFLAEPSEISFGDVLRLLTAFDFVEERSSGSHHIVRHPDGRNITIPKKGGRKVKGFYVTRINQLLYLEDWYEQHNS
jgi:predicted RNA binding protein YcfA (HicA-like mRNA interferase family)